MVSEDKNLVVEGQVESSDTDSDAPEDDFDLNQGENDGSDSDEDEESDEDESENEEENPKNKKGDLEASVEIGEGDESESDDNDEEESVESNGSDAESEDNNDEHETDEEADGNAGWADAMAKVLAMGKNSDKAVSVLSKAKKDNVNKKAVKNGDNVGSDGEEEEKEEVEQKLVPLALRKARKREIDSIGRKMPDVLDRNAEKALVKIATRGVVQLFNAVREQQKDIKSKLKEAGGSFRKQEKVFKNIDKNSFVEILTGKSISKPQGEPLAKKPKTEVKDENDENQSTWNILRDDFMLGAKMRDWDKESDGE